MAVMQLPQHGALYAASTNGTRLQQITAPCSSNDMVVMIAQYAADVVAVSSFWVGSDQWHPGQILGPQDATYGGSDLSWCVRGRAECVHAHTLTFALAWASAAHALTFSLAWDAVAGHR
jgi:hypothetical protein